MRGGRRNDLGDPARHGIDVSDTISPEIAAEIDTVFLCWCFSFQMFYQRCVMVVIKSILMGPKGNIS